MKNHLVKRSHSASNRLVFALCSIFALFFAISASADSSENYLDLGDSSKWTPGWHPVDYQVDDSGIPIGANDAALRFNYIVTGDLRHKETLFSDCQLRLLVKGVVPNDVANKTGIYKLGGTDYAYIEMQPSPNEQSISEGFVEFIPMDGISVNFKTYCYVEPKEMPTPPVTSAAEPSLKITSPESLITVGATPIQVQGRVSSDMKELTVNGQKIDHSSGNFSASVSLVEGFNNISVKAKDSEGVVYTSSIVVSLDLTPPYITVESHTHKQIVSSNEVTVTGLINDIVRGTVEAEQAKVFVNDKPAKIRNRSYSVTGINLNPGKNLIKIKAFDQVGNLNEKELVLIYEKPKSTKKLEYLSGNFQESEINSQLQESLVVKLLGREGKPLPNEPVVFRVIQGSGSLSDDAENVGKRALAQHTNADGIASVQYTLGARTGSNNHKVMASAVGVDNQIDFLASATPRPIDKISVNFGNNQRGVINQPLPQPFVVVVTDEGANVVKGVEVEFIVHQGEGVFENGKSRYKVLTDSDGRATAHYSLGPIVGMDAQRVNVKVPASTNELQATFTASAFEPQAAGATSVSGIVLNTESQPIPGVTLSIEGTSRKAVSDKYGFFKIENTPVGPVHLLADGSTAQVKGEFPTLGYRLVTVSGVDNPLSAPIYMVKLNTEASVFAGPKDVSLTFEDLPGFKLDIAKDSVTFPDGSREGYISVTPVNSEAIPMAPPNGMQPQLIVTIQPTGTRFDPPARLTLPNVDAHNPGAQVEMYSLTLRTQASNLYN